MGQSRCGNENFCIIILELITNLVYHGVRKESLNDQPDLLTVAALVHGFGGFFNCNCYADSFEGNRNRDLIQLRLFPFSNLTMRITSLAVEM